MWKKTRLPAMLALALLCWLFAPGLGSCSESRTYQISESELTTLEQHLSMLQANNKTLTLLLSESGEGLTIAAEELTRLRLELCEARRALEESQKSLAQMKSDADEARQSLRTANEELKKAGESFKASERERDRIEGRLRTQRNIWEALFAVAVGVAVAR